MLNRKTLAALALLASGGPFAVDMYLPAFPAIAADLNTTQPMVQLTLTSFMVGMALGQLGIGALSDAHGRRTLLILGMAIAAGASAACALAPSISVFIAARFVLGLGSGAGVVLARAIISDVSTGVRAARAFSLMMMIQGLAPVIAPIIGGMFAEPLGWRGLFWILTGLATLQLAVAMVLIRETLPPTARTPSTLCGFGGNLLRVLRNRVFVGYLVAFAFGFGGLFSYISASPFVIQEELGLAPALYSVVFALNSVGIVLGSASSARLVRHSDPHVLLRNSTLVMLLAGAALILVPVQPWAILPLLFIVAFCLGFILGNATALGTGAVRDRAGTGSALMGFGQYLVGGLVSPLVGLGSNPTFAMGCGVFCCGATACAGVWLARKSA